MNEYVVTYFTDSVGTLHEHAKRSKDNQQCMVVKADTPNQAKEKARELLKDVD